MKLRLSVIFILLFIVCFYFSSCSSLGVSTGSSGVSLKEQELKEQLLNNFKAGVAAYDRGDFNTALEKFKPIAEQGDARAQYYLGVLYKFGEGLSQNDVEAEKWFQLASKKLPELAEGGDAVAQFFMGNMYHTGRGIVQNDTEAVKWWTLAAEQGYPNAQNNLG